MILTVVRGSIMLTMMSSLVRKIGSFQMMGVVLVSHLTTVLLGLWRDIVDLLLLLHLETFLQKGIRLDIWTLLELFLTGTIAVHTILSVPHATGRATMITGNAAQPAILHPLMTRDIGTIEVGPLMNVTVTMAIGIGALVVWRGLRMIMDETMMVGTGLQHSWRGHHMINEGTMAIEKQIEKLEQSRSRQVTMEAKGKKENII